MYELTIVSVSPAGDFETLQVAFDEEPEAWETGHTLAQAKGSSLVSWDVAWVAE